MNILEITNKIAIQQSYAIDAWAIKNGVTMENISKFKIKYFPGTPTYEHTETGIIGRSNSRYELYPARGRNAKKLISILQL